MSFTQNNLDEIRRDQAREGSRMTDSQGFGGLRTNARPPAAGKKAVTKGHEAFLKALETSGTDVRIEKKSSGEIVVGKVKHSDRYTITMRVDNADGETYLNRVIFKHDISEFNAVHTRPELATTAEGVTLQ